MDVTLGIETGFEQLRQTVVTRWSAAVLFGNLGDAMSTLAFLQMEIAEELNPMMDVAYQASPLWFMAVKLSLVHLALLVLYLNRHMRAARVGEAMGGILYSALLVWHAVCWTAL